MARMKRAMTFYRSCLYFRCQARTCSGHRGRRIQRVRLWVADRGRDDSGDLNQRRLDALGMLFQDFKISHGTGMKFHVDALRARDDVRVDVKHRLACG